MDVRKDGLTEGRRDDSQRLEERSGADGGVNEGTNGAVFLKTDAAQRGWETRLHSSAHNQRFTQLCQTHPFIPLSSGRHITYAIFTHSLPDFLLP